MSHHNSYDMSRQVMSTINLMHEMAEIKDQLTRSATMRADAQRRVKEAEEDTVRSQLRLNNLEISLRDMQHDTEHRLKRARLHSEHDAETAAEQQQWEPRDRQRMPPPTNPLETTGSIDDASRCQHRSGAGKETEENRSLLQTIQEQVVSDVRQHRRG
jgi:hypothetical protein